MFWFLAILGIFLMGFIYFRNDVFGINKKPVLVNKKDKFKNIKSDISLKNKVVKAETANERKEIFNDSYHLFRKKRFLIESTAIENNLNIDVDVEDEFDIEIINSALSIMDEFETEIEDSLTESEKIANSQLNDLLNDANKTFVTVLIFLFSSFLFAQDEQVFLVDVNPVVVEPDTVFVEKYDDVVKVDSVNLVISKKVKKVKNENYVFNKLNYKDNYVNIKSDWEVYLTYNSLIGNTIQTYKGYKWLPKVYSLYEYYFPLIDNIFKYYGVPSELSFLAIVESNLNPRAISSVGASGIWQFMPATGKQYGLVNYGGFNSFYDPYESTVSAALFLKDLYKEFGDWNLAISAYNCGGGNVRKAIRKAGSDHYWSVRPYLPSETRDYLLRYYAVKYLYYHYEHYYTARFDFGFTFSDVKEFKAPNHTTFKEFASANNLDLDMLYFLNPHLVTEQIVSGSYVYYIK